VNNSAKEPYLLENWGVGEINPSAYKAPEARTLVLTGRVMGNPKFMAGEYITTSRLICSLDMDVVQTINSFYRLGDPDPEYERLFPHAKARLIEALLKQCDQPHET
jgi:hypothetical protein